MEGNSNQTRQNNGIIDYNDEIGDWKMRAFLLGCVLDFSMPPFIFYISQSLVIALISLVLSFVITIRCSKFGKDLSKQISSREDKKKIIWYFFLGMAFVEIACISIFALDTPHRGNMVGDILARIMVDFIFWTGGLLLKVIPALIVRNAIFRESE